MKFNLKATQIARSYHRTAILISANRHRISKYVTTSWLLQEQILTSAWAIMCSIIQKTCKVHT